MTAKSSRGHKHPPSGPLVLDTNDLGRRPGAMQEVRRAAPAPDDLGVDLIKVPPGSPLDLDLRLESVAEGVLVTGTVTARAEGECGRCLDPVAETVQVQLVELFAYPGSVTDETTDEDEIARLVEDRIDLEPVIRNAIVLALPLTPLCDPDCAGLCAGCGERLDDLPKDHTHEMIDPRWAGLREKFDSPEQ
ncbi:YceD family protein [Cumulibacter manganitolerans]|uniref:YceD family protein n=1 Tax=Cumulibacter manganitolerans TaxID=1884992 RepID=UPI001294BFED|nr:YceD family protein [Cumulibacter manganitolerans]